MSRSGINAYGQRYGEDLKLSDIKPEQWAIAINGYRHRGFWDERHYGAPPGKPGCRCPDWLQAASKDEIQKLREKFNEANSSPY